MKKSIKIFGVVLGALLLTACGGSGSSEEDANTTKLTCKQSLSGESYEVVAVLDGDKIKSVSAEATFDSEEGATTYKTFLEFMAEIKETDMGISADGNKLTIKNYAPVLESDDGEDKVVVIGETKDNFIEIMKQQNYSCE